MNDTTFQGSGNVVYIPAIINDKLKQTNADCIRAMSDEELAQMFWEKASCELCKLKKQYCSDDCKGTWLEWLRQEISE